MCMQILWLCWGGGGNYHMLRCEWASCEQMNRDNIQQIVKVLHASNRLT